MNPIAEHPVVLIAEPDPIIALDLSDALTEAGYQVLEPASGIAEALHLLERYSPALAIIDVVLKDGRCTSLVRALRQQGIPFLVHSAARQDQRLTGDFQDAPWLSKPALPADVVAVLDELSTSASAPAGKAPSPKPTASIHPLRPSVPACNPLIRKLEGFTALSDADRAMLARISAETRRVVTGTDLVCEGDKPEGVFLVMDGMASRHKLRANGTRQITAYLVPGDLCDLDVALLSEMDHTITTLSACEVVCLSPVTVASLLTNHPQIARALRMAQLVDEATLREWLVNVGSRSALERVAHLFCELQVRLQVVGLAEDGSFDLPLTQEVLADTTGLSSVHLNRTLQELRRKGLIELRHRRLTILDLPRIRALAEFKANYLHLGERAAA